MGFGMWELLQFLLNAFLFILIGLQLPAVLDALEGESPATLIGWAAAVSAAVVLCRLRVAVARSCIPIRWLDATAARSTRTGPHALAGADRGRLGGHARRRLARGRARAARPTSRSATRSCS